MSDYTVHDEPDFARVYDEDEMISVRKGDLRALLDVASTSMDFGSGFLDNEQVEVLRKAAVTLDIDPLTVTPPNFVCQYQGKHTWSEYGHHADAPWCTFCSARGPVPSQPPQPETPKRRGAPVPMPTEGD